MKRCLQHGFVLVDMDSLDKAELIKVCPRCTYKALHTMNKEVMKLRTFIREVKLAMQELN